MGTSVFESTQCLTVQVTSKGEVLYEDRTSGGIQSCFTDNVLGSWTFRRGDGTYASRLVDLEFSPSDDSLTLTLKPGVTFHNGRPISAHDIEFSLLRGFWQKETPYYASFLKSIDGVSEKLSKPRPGSVSGIEIIDRQTLRLKFKNSCPEIVNTLSLPFFAPRPNEEMREDFVHFKRLPIGAGTYQVVEELASGYNLLRVAGEGPQNVRFLTKAESKPSDVIFGDLKRPNSYTVSSTKAASATLTMFTSASHPMFCNPRVRELFGQVFERDKLATIESYSPTTTLSLSGKEKRLSLDQIEAARAELRGLLAQSNLTFTIPIQAAVITQTMVKVTAELAGQLATVGLQVNFVARSDKFLKAEQATAFPFWLW